MTATSDRTWLVALAAALWGTDALLRQPLAGALPATTVVFWEHLIIVLTLVPWLPSAARAWPCSSTVPGMTYTAAPSRFAHAAKVASFSVAVSSAGIQMLCGLPSRPWPLSTKPRSGISPSHQLNTVSRKWAI